MKKFCETFFLLIICFSILSCDSITSLKNTVLESVGLSDSQTAQKKTQKTKSKKSKRKTAQKKEKKAESHKINIIHKDKTNDYKLKRKDLKAVKKQAFKVEAPVQITKRVGGVARSIFDDDKYIYIDFPQHFSIYDHQLNLVAKQNRKKDANPILDIKRVVLGEDTFLVIKQENNILEILELRPDEAKPQVFILEEIGSYDVGVDFYWLNKTIFVNLLRSKIQFLDLGNPDDVRIVSELPISGVKDIFKIQNYLYLSRNGVLDILNLKNDKLVSSVRLGQNFGFMGTLSKNKNTYLLLSLLDKDGALLGYQYVELLSDGSGVRKLDEIIYLDEPLVGYSFNLELGFVIGKEKSDEKKVPLKFYSFKYRKFLRGEISSLHNLMSWSLSKKYLYLVTSKEISLNQIQLNPDIINKSKTINKLIDRHITRKPPFAKSSNQVKVVKDEYSLLKEKSLEFMTNSSRVALLDFNNFILLEKDKEGFHKIFTSTDFSQEEFHLKELKLPEKMKIDLLLNTGEIGVFFYSQQNEEIYFVGVDLNQLTKLPLNSKGLISWGYFANSTGDFLAMVKENLKSSSKSNKYILEFYKLESAEKVSKVSEIPLEEKSYLFYHRNDFEIYVANRQGLEAYDVSDPSKVSKIEDKKVVFKAPLEILGAKVSPNLKHAYLLYMEKDFYKIKVLDIENFEGSITLKDFEIKSSQFFGSSFSKGGQLFILPTTEGTLFYDMTTLEKKSEEERIVAHWPLPSESVDVAQKGRFVCVALGAKGVYCGELLYY